MFSSCSGSNRNLNGSNELNPDSITRNRQKVPDPEIQADCTNSWGRNGCEGDNKCEKICNDIFSSRDKKDCYALPRDLVFEFETLLEDTESGKVEGINANVLRCMLDIDEREFAKAVKKMSRTNSKNFLIAIKENEQLAKVLYSEDDEFNILEQLLYGLAGSNNLTDQLKDEIEGDKTIIWLASEGNEFMWKWLDGYVNEECDSSNADCPGKESIGAYCNALLDMSKTDLENFLKNADLFATQYQDGVEREYGESESTFLYEVKNNEFDEDEIGDFRDYCRSIVSGCGPENTFRITFERGTDTWHGAETIPIWNANNGFATPAPPDINQLTYYPDSISDSRYTDLLANIVINFPNTSSGRNADLSAVVIGETEYTLRKRSNSRQYTAEVTDFNTSQLTKHICFKRSDGSYWSEN